MVQLMTKEGAALLESGATPWACYPRPRMRRETWLNLNGWWEFATGDRSVECESRIRVPFCPESVLSGVGRHFGEGAALCYRKTVRLPESFSTGRVLLHIGAADQVLECAVNGKNAGRHEGGYEHITFDITDHLAEENTIELACYDDLNDQSFPYGKQVQKRGGMWYTPVSGIWQTVWLESVPEHYIEKLNVKNHGYSVTITMEPAMDAVVSVAGLGDFEMKNGTVTITPENPRLWSPESPCLYDFTVTTAEDKVESYFAIRSLEIKQVDKYPRLCLNGEPYFFHGLLDQGYWPDGLLTPPGPESFADDILAMKALGFNTLRKHIKVEPDEFYYQCDKLGMIVFQDMVNNGGYGYVRDTVMPTISLAYQKRGDRNLHKDAKVRERFIRGMEATVEQLGSFPCICLWTIFNEGWGQFDADAVYEQFVKLDDTRFIDSTSGWFRRKKTQVDSRHVYFRKVNLEAKDKPLYLSEFGGYSCKIEGHSFNPDETYGYGKFTDRGKFVDALTALYMDQIVPCVEKGLSAAVYTQVSDVEDETNGLRTYDRRIEKVTPAEMRPIAEALRKSGCKKSPSGVK